MKITNADVIQTGEQELIDAITADLDWGVIEEIFRKEHKLGIQEEIEYKKGDIIASNNQIAYRLEFEVKVNLAILLDRKGEYISITISGDEDIQEGKVEEKIMPESVKIEDASRDETKDPSEQGFKEKESHIDDDVEGEPNDWDKNNEGDAFDEIYNELDSMEVGKNTELNQHEVSEDSSQGSISRLVSQVGKFLEEEKRS